MKGPDRVRELLTGAVALIPELFSPYFNVTKNIHPHGTRSTTRKNYFEPHVNSNSAKKSLLFMGTKIWNGLRFEWKEYSYTKFKKAVKSHLLLKYSKLINYH